MRSAIVCLITVLGIASSAFGQTLASRSFDMLFVGDDPTEGFDFLLPSNSLTPVNLTFNGYFENLNAEETGVRAGALWHVTGTTWDGVVFTGEDGFRLPGADPVSGTTRVPLSFVQPIGFTPSQTRFWVEGLGPSDRFRFVGDFNIVPVPEPAVVTLLAFAAVGFLFRGKRRN